MGNKNSDIVKTYKDIKQDYAFDPSIFSEEPERTARLKEIIEKRLSAVDRTIILLYIDMGSLRKVGAVMGFSHSTIATEVNRIKKIILNEYYKTK